MSSPTFCPNCSSKSINYKWSEEKQIWECNCNDCKVSWINTTFIKTSIDIIKL